MAFLWDWPPDQEIRGLKLVCTCGACPEQYDVLNSQGIEVGYLRLRHGHFRAEYTPSDEEVYSADTNGDGIFDEDERQFHLEKAVDAILERMNKWNSN